MIMWCRGEPGGVGRVRRNPALARENQYKTYKFVQSPQLSTANKKMRLTILFLTVLSLVQSAPIPQVALPVAGTMPDAAGSPVAGLAAGAFPVAGALPPLPAAGAEDALPPLPAAGAEDELPPLPAAGVSTVPPLPAGDVLPVDEAEPTATLGASLAEPGNDPMDSAIVDIDALPPLSADGAKDSAPKSATKKVEPKPKAADPKKNASKVVKMKEQSGPLVAIGDWFKGVFNLRSEKEKVAHAQHDVDEATKKLNKAKEHMAKKHGKVAK
jgi:hypothetical protein